MNKNLLLFRGEREASGDSILIVPFGEKTLIFRGAGSLPSFPMKGERGKDTFGDYSATLEGYASYE